ncbi:MAG: hypothetical protein FWC09_02475 [Lachnospiraceae bacterium]|nr:hypothetical protein [Lachnospiraceae bacterium]
MNKINYKIDFMIELETHYSEAESALDDVIAELKNGKDVLEDFYKGMATDINGESIDRYKEHLEFLKLCCQAAKRHVTISRYKMTSTDAQNSDSQN